MRPLHSQRGYSLTEAIVTLMLVVLVTAAMSTGVAFAARQYSNSVQISQAKVLESTLKNVIENELQITRNDIELGATVPGSLGTEYTLERFYSVNYGLNDSLSRFETLGGESYGEIVLASNESKLKILPSSTYPRDLGASVDVSCHFSPMSGSPEKYQLDYFHVTLTVATREGTELIKDGFDVVPFTKIENVVIPSNS